jgi:hypothetical protein
MEKPLDPSVLENIKYLEAQLDEQETLLFHRVDYILKQIAAKFGGEIEFWRVVDSYDGQTIKDCVGTNFVAWYHICWKTRPKSLTIVLDRERRNLGSEFPTRWLTKNFEEELEKLAKECKI